MTTMKLSATLAMVILAAAGCANDEKSAMRETSSGDARAMGMYGTQDGDEGDEAVALEDCPDAVQATIRAHMDGGTITELERTTDHGEVLYEVDVRTGKGVVEFDVAADGTFRGYEADDDDDAAGEDFDDDGDDEEVEIPLSEVPQAAIDAAKAAVPGIVFEEAEREIEDGVTVYCLEGEAGGVEYEVEVTADGTVNEVETEADDDGEEDDD